MDSPKMQRKISGQQRSLQAMAGTTHHFKPEANPAPAPRASLMKSISIDRQQSVEEKKTARPSCPSPILARAALGMRNKFGAGGPASPGAGAKPSLIGGFKFS